MGLTSKRKMYITQILNFFVDLELDELQPCNRDFSVRERGEIWILIGVFAYLTPLE